MLENAKIIQIPKFPVLQYSRHRLYYSHLFAELKDQRLTIYTYLLLAAPNVRLPEHAEKEGV